MIIKTLVENTSDFKNLEGEHGLSLYIETKTQKVLFDTGASSLFAENAKKMDVDLTKVDIAVISHGHYDHGGGLKAFLHINNHAKVYLNKRAFEKYYVHRFEGVKEYIGLDEALLPNKRFVFVGSHMVIDEELELFSHVKGERLNPSGNKDLFMEAKQRIVPDDFVHEQNLVIKEDGNIVLAAGCAHNGIVNILEHFQKENNCLPSHVLGGFHLYNPSAQEHEDPVVTAEIGAYLLNTNAMFYTCHCTGIVSYERLRFMMGEKVEYLSTGSQIII